MRLWTDTARAPSRRSFDAGRAVLYALALLVLATAASPVLAQARKPLVMEGHRDFYQRVLTLPGAQLRAEPASTARIAGDRVPTFSILYVFARRTVDGTPWLEVSASPDGRDPRWLRASEAQDWAVMLVMQYAPPGQRQRVLFFNDASRLSSPRAGSAGRAEVEGGRPGGRCRHA